MEDAQLLITKAILGYDFEVVRIGGKRYTVYPPTIKKLCGAITNLGNISGKDSIKDAFSAIDDPKCLCRALSWFIRGDESLAEELEEGSVNEVLAALTTAFDLISLENFIKLSSSVRNVRSLIASQRS